uniref:Uncharacterized protein n=1 Tax=Glossina pallidipes TaxID=7398 RepID=A0A1B0A5J3_GLOPL
MLLNEIGDGPEVCNENSSFPVSKKQAESMESPSKYNVVSDKYKATKGVDLELANKDNDGELLEANPEAISSKEFNANSYTNCDSISYEENSAEPSKIAGSAELENISIRKTYDLANNLMIKNQICLVKRVENTIEQDIRSCRSTHTKENVERQDFDLYVRSNKCGTGFPNDKKIKNLKNSIGMYGLINTLWNTANRYTYQAVSSLTKANTILNESIKKRVVVKTSDDNLHNEKNFQIFVNTSSSSNETRSPSRVNLLELLESTDKDDVPSPAFENIKKYYTTAKITLQAPSKNNQFRANDINASSINKNLKDGENSTGFVNTIRKTTRTNKFRSFYSITKTTTELTEIIKKDTIIVNYSEPVRSNAVTTLHHDWKNKKTNSITLNALNKSQEESSTSPGEFGNIQHVGKESHLITTIHVQDPVVSEKGSNFPNDNNVKRLKKSTGFHGLFNAIRYTTNSYTSCFLSSFKKPAVEIPEAVERSLDSSKPIISSELKIANVNLRNEKTWKIVNNASSPLSNETQFRSKVKLLELLENASEEDKPSAVFENIKRYRTAATIMIQSPKDRNDESNEYDVSVSNNNNVEKPNSSAGLHGLVNIMRNAASSCSYLSLSSFKKSAVEITEAIKKSLDSTAPTISSELRIANVNLRNEKTWKILNNASPPLSKETQFRSKVKLLELLENASEEDKPSAIFENIKRYRTAATIMIQSPKDRNDQLNEYDVSVSNNNNVEKPNSSAGLHGSVNITRDAANSYSYRSLSSFKKPIIEITEPVKESADSPMLNTSNVFCNKKTFKILGNVSSPALLKSRAKVEWLKLLKKASKTDKCSPTKEYHTTATILLRDHNTNKGIDRDGIDVSNNNSLESTTGLYGLVNTIKKTSYRYCSFFSFKKASNDVTKIIKESKPDANSFTTPASSIVTALHHGRRNKKTTLNFNNILTLKVMNKTMLESEVEAQENVNKKNPEGQTLDLSGSTYSNDNEKQIAETDMSIVETGPVVVDEVVKYKNSSELTMKMPEQQNNDLKESINNNDSRKSAAKIYISADEAQCTLLDEAVEKDNKFTDSPKAITINPEQQNNDLKKNINSSDNSKLIAKTYTPSVEAGSTPLDEAVEKDNKFTDSPKMITTNPEQQNNDLKENINSNDNSKLIVKTYTPSVEAECVLLNGAIEKDYSKSGSENPEHQNSNLKDSINSDDKNKMAIEIHTSAAEAECVPIEKAVEKDNKCNDSSKTVMKNPEKQNNQLAKCINSTGNGKQTPDTNVTSAGSVEKHTKYENPSEPIAKKSDSRNQVSKETINKKENAKQVATTSTSTAEAKSTLASKVIEKNAKTKLSGTASSQSIDKNTGAKPKCTSVSKASVENKTCQTSSQLGAKSHSTAGNKKGDCKQVAAFASSTKTKNVSANKLTKKETKCKDSSQTTTNTANQRNVNTSNCKPVVFATSRPIRPDRCVNRNQSACVNRNSYCYQSYNSYGYSNYCSGQGYYNCGGSYWGGC